MGSTTVFLSERLLGGSGRAEGVRQSGRKRKAPSRYGDYANIEEDDGDGNVDDQSNNADDDDEDEDDEEVDRIAKRVRANNGDAVRVRGTKKPATAALKASKADFLTDLSGFLLKKWKKAHDDGTLKASVEEFNKKKTTKCKRSIIVRKINGVNQPVVQMECSVCGIVKDLLPEFWNRKTPNLSTSKPGQESFSNSPTYPCKVCKVGVSKANNSTIRGWVRSTLSPYKKLGGEAWFWKQWKDQGGDFTVIDGKYSVTRNARCTKTGLQMKITGEGRSTSWSPSVNNVSPLHTKQAEHISEHCELIVAELNVQQKGAIPDLALAVITMIKNAAEIMKKSLSAGGRSALLKESISYSQMLAANWKNSAKQNGVNVSQAVNRKRYDHQYINKTVRGLCSNACSNHAKSDAKLKRTPAVSQLTPIEMYRRWWSRCRCTYSHIIVSLIQGFTRVSVDRVGPHKCSHELEHVELCIRLLNSPAGMTRKKFCFLMINQTKVKLAQDVLKAYKNELAALEKGDPLPEPEPWLRPFVSAADDDDDVEDSNLHEDEEVVEEVVVDEEVVDEEEDDDEDGDEVHEHQEDDDDSQAHSSADSDDSDDESYLPGDDEEENDIDDVIDLVVEDDDVLAGYVAPPNIFTRFYNEVLQGWATVRTNWMSLWQRMAGHFLVEAPVMIEEEEVIINDDVFVEIFMPFEGTSGDCADAIASETKTKIADDKNISLRHRVSLTITD